MASKQLNMPRFILILLVSTFSFNAVYAQDKSDSGELWHGTATNILVGGQIAEYSFLELGVHRTTITKAILSAGYSASVESNVRKNNFIWAPKIQGWFMYNFVHANVASIYYLGKDENSIKIRPELGFGLWFGKITYGYNFSLTNKGMMGVSKHKLCVNLLLGI